MNKLIAFITTMFLCSEPMPAYAESENSFSETIDGNTFTYTVGADMNATITGCESYEAEIIIPSSLGGYMVTSIGEMAFFGKIMMNSVTIPEGIRYIGNNAFSGCLSLTDVKFPETLTSIGNGCFMSCSELESVFLNNSISSIPDNCFNSCTSLKNINIPESVVFIGTEAFFGCPDLSGIFIPSTVGIIGDNAFGMHSGRNSVIEKINNFRLRGLPDTAVTEYAENTGIEIYCKIGDVNCDNFIDAVDASIVSIEYANVSTNREPTFDTYQKYVADYNNDGFIDAVDATLISMEYARLQTLPNDEM
ncbi:MAG: leucine-rich repeat protein [Ruminococcus sp.]|nr:leucine-rich repeat protein [Ruminococcus sp.]